MQVPKLDAWSVNTFLWSCYFVPRSLKVEKKILYYLNWLHFTLKLLRHNLKFFQSLATLFYWGGGRWGKETTYYVLFRSFKKSWSQFPNIYVQNSLIIAGFWISLKLIECLGSWVVSESTTKYLLASFDTFNTFWKSLSSELLHLINNL